MMDLNLYVAFTGVVILLAITPGTDNLYILTRALSEGRRAGFLAALGIAFGLMVHITAATLGLSQVFKNAPVAFSVIRWAGIVYLAWLAYQAWQTRVTKISTAKNPAPLGQVKIIRDAMTLCLLNPKLLLFFIAFLPQFTNPAVGSMNVQFFILGVTFAVESLTVFVLAVIFVAPLGGYLRQHPQFWNRQGKVTGVVLGAMALTLAVFG